MTKNSKHLLDVLNALNVPKVKRVFRTGSEIFTAIAPFAERPTAFNGLKAAFGVGKALVNDFEVWPDEYFDDAWVAPYPKDFNKVVFQALAGKPITVVKSSSESSIIHLVDFEGVKFGYVKNVKNDYVDRIHVEVKNLERGKELVKNELWRLLKDDNIVLRQPKRIKSDFNEDVILEKDEAFKPMPSRRAAEYTQYLKKCIDAGLSRSVMLYGPPGTGKSTMARTIVDSLKMRSFRIRVEDVGFMENSTIFEAINIFEPDAVILDDFDRTGEQASLLETLEFFQRHVKLVLATVNNKNKLDEAVLRPGRFDELIQIKQMDDDVVRSVLGVEYSYAYDTVKDWPIAFIQEYVKRLKFMTAAEAEDSIKELAQRVKNLKDYDENNQSDEDRVLNKKSVQRVNKKN